MAILKIHTYPDNCLRKRAREITAFDDKLKALVDNMAQTMYEAPGIGLAAVQVNINRRVVVIDVSEDRDDLNVLINPQIISATGMQEYEEGCLSIPGVFAVVQRPSEVDVKAYNIDGEIIEFQAEGLYAICIQHEIDHLEGTLFLDHLSRLKRDRIYKKLEKEAKSDQKA